MLRNGHDEERAAGEQPFGILLNTINSYFLAFDFVVVFFAVVFFVAPVLCFAPQDMGFVLSVTTLR
ncbi:MAG: hypothetical protein WC581_07490 [Thermodesulfovibrionales bacterium]